MNYSLRVITIYANIHMHINRMKNNAKTFPVMSNLQSNRYLNLDFQNWEEVDQMSAFYFSWYL